ncbi:hypothetical protein Clacol_010301 [Clathrus columnatus]|uniref:F-box domain-containing protein n=1 Tax=Clathrus columnatus TaxID=1419009 RepID=A0AAV5AMW6_9AGAM|nr:hypothetical protein Clacol_010301 [Clathrus columnatus]
MLVTINRLPVELFTCIITFAELPTDRFRHPFLLYTWVCHHWRSIIIEDSDFWTLFRLQLIPTHPTIDPFSRELLRRSKSAKLDSALTIKSPQSTSTLEDLITQESSRIVRLWLSTDQPKLIQTVFLNKSFSMLQAFTHAGRSHTLIALLPLLISANQLSAFQCTLGVTFSANDLNQLIPVFSRLRSLSLYIHTPEIFQSVLLLLHDNAKLQDLQLEMHNKRGTDAPGQIILPELQFLSINFSSVLENFRTPKLSALDVTCSRLFDLLGYPIFKDFKFSPIRCLYVLDSLNSRGIHSFIGLHECFHAEFLFSTKTEGFTDDTVFLEDVEDVFKVTDISLHYSPREYFNIKFCSDDITGVLERALSPILSQLKNITELYLLSRVSTGLNGIPFEEIITRTPNVEKLVVQYGDKLKDFIHLIRNPSIFPELKHISYTISYSVSLLYELVESFADDIGKSLIECLQSRQKTHGNKLKFIALGNCPPLPDIWLEELQKLGTTVITEKNVNKLIVDETSVEIAFTDSGAPSQTPYITIIAVHGMCFSGAIFQKTQELAPRKSIRFVAINRRNYPGSTPFTASELEVLTQGSEEEKTAWLDARGHEIANFIVRFIEKENIPPVTGKTGGVILLGWSVGVGEANATIAAADSLPTPVRSIFTKYLRSLILHEGAPIMLGLPMPEKNWAPFLVDSIPPEFRLPVFGQWVTSYFKHGDLNSRDLNVLSYVLPSTHRVPTIFNISAPEQKSTIFDGVEGSYEGIYTFRFGNQLNKVYRKALFDTSTRDLFPHLKTSFLAGTETASFGIAGLWSIQQDCEKSKNASIKLKLAPECNHFVQWDDPALALSLYLECSGL